MNYKLIPSLRNFTISLANALTSVKVFKKYHLLMINEEPDQIYKANGVDAPKDLLPFQTALKHHRGVAVNATATLTGAQIKSGLITSTSVAAVTATTPTATALATALGAKAGTWFDFAIDNSAGASIVTLAGGTNVTAATAVVTGGDTLTVAIGAVGLFRIYFSSPTVAKVYRLG